MEYYYNNQVKTIAQLKESFKNVSFPAKGPESQWMVDNKILEVEGWPTIDSVNQAIESTSGSNVDGSLSSSQWDELRDTRNLLLTNSDFTQLNDSPKDKSKWESYRKALRDLPETYPNADDVIWPTEPNS
jgi:hypothetical protein